MDADRDVAVLAESRIRSVLGPGEAGEMIWKLLNASRTTL
jgi:hypothetical protein